MLPLLIVLDKIMNETKELNLSELRKLYNHIGALLPPAVVYQQKPSKCGCKRCKARGSGHGLYWYAYFSYQNKTHCIYVGKEKREIHPLEELEKKKSRKRRFKNGTL